MRVTDREIARYLGVPVPAQVQRTSNLHAARKALGLCYICGRKQAPGKTRCNHCMTLAKFRGQS